MLRTLYIFRAKLTNGTSRFLYSFDSKMDDGYSYLNIVTNSREFVMRKNIVRFKRVLTQQVDISVKNWYEKLMEVKND